MKKQNTAEILIEALPYIKSFAGKIMVIKLGGSIMDDEDKLSDIIQDIILMKYVGIRPILVHGGGKHISSLMERLGKKAVFVDGLRVTDKDTMALTQMVLAGLVNKDIVSMFARQGGKAVGISGKDGGLIIAKKLKKKKKVDYGQVGEIVSINPEIILTLKSNNFVPVISPIANDDQGNSLNINADLSAMKIAESLKAEKMIFLTDVPGVLKDINDPASLIQKISKKEIPSLIKSKIISAGMIPKLRSTKEALDNGTGSIHIIGGKIKHSLLLELFTQEGIGTKIS